MNKPPSLDQDERDLENQSDVINLEGLEETPLAFLAFAVSEQNITDEKVFIFLVHHKILSSSQAWNLIQVLLRSADIFPPLDANPYMNQN